MDENARAAEELLPLVYEELHLLAAQKIDSEQFQKRQRTDNFILLPAL